MRKKWTYSILITIILILAACGSNSASTSSDTGNAETETKSFKMHTNVPESHLFTQTAEKFKEELETLSNGEMTVELYPNSQLGESDEIIQMMETGTLDFALFPSAFLVSDYPELNAWYMPFLFSNTEEAIDMKDSDTAQELLNVFDGNGIMAVSWLFTPNHSILMKEGKIESPSDLKGKTMRSPGVAVLEDFYSAVGAGSQSLPISELYQSLQTGVVDGINASQDSIVSQKLYEVANDFSLLHQSAFNGPGLISQATYDSLNDEQKEIVTDAMSSAIDWGNSEVLKQAEDNLKELEDAGLNIHQIENIEAFHELRDEIYEEYATKHPIINSFIEEAEERYPK